MDKSKAQSFKVGQAPWEQGEQESFPVGQAPWEQKKEDGFTGEGLVRGTLQALPTAGAMAGGLIGSALGPAGIYGGGALGAAGGKALQTIGEGFLGDEITREKLYGGPIKEGAIESIGQGVGGLLGGAARMGSKYLKEPMMGFLGRVGAPEKAAAPLIKESAERLGVEPTRGMLTGDRVVQNIESGLAQTATGPGQKLQGQLQDVGEGLKKAGEEVLSSGKQSATPIQLAQQAKSQIEGVVGERLAPAKEIYKKIEGEIPFVEVGDKSTKRIAHNLRNLPFAKIKGSPESALAEQIAGNLENVKSLDELRNLRSYLGKAFNDPNMSPTMRETAGEMYGRLSKLEQNSITRSAIASSNAKSGPALAREMIGEIKGANKIYSQVSNELKEFARQTGLGKVTNYQDFLNKMNAVTDEKFLDKVFNTANVKNLSAIQKQFPQAFETMKQARMSKIYTDSLTKGELSIPKLLTNIKKMSPEAQKLLLGEKPTQTIKDIENVYNSLYQKVGPSGTPEGIEYIAFGVLNPKSWFNQMTAKANEYMLANPEKFKKFSDKAFDSQMNRAIPKSMGEVKEKAGRDIMKYYGAPSLGRGLLRPDEE